MNEPPLWGNHGGMARGSRHLLAVWLTLALPRAAVAQEAPPVASGVRVRVSVPPDAPAETRLWVDGEELPRDAWSRPIVVPAGEVSVRVERPGREPLRVTLHVADGATMIVPIRWPERRALPPPAAPPAAPISGWRVLGWVGIVLGAGALATGGYFFAQNLQLRHEVEASPAWAFFNARVNPVDGAGSRALDGDAVCDLAATNSAASAEAYGLAVLCRQNARLRTLSWALGASGATLVALGVTAVILAPRPRARARVAPMASPDALGAVVTVRF